MLEQTQSNTIETNVRSLIVLKGVWVEVALSAHGWTRQRSSSALWLLDIC